MDTEKKLHELAGKMTELYTGDPKRIQHFTKVHAFAKFIGEQELLDGESMFILETAAYVHDIAIRYCEKKYGGKCHGALQEKEGPALARQLLTEQNFPTAVTERVCYLVGHHHTYTNIDGEDYRILVEADFLVNMYEDDFSETAKRQALKNIFRTDSGTHLCRTMYGLTGNEPD
jgi:HD superfamily phosphodiesterase